MKERECVTECRRERESVCICMLSMFVLSTSCHELCFVLFEGCSLNATTFNGDTPLHVAARHQNSGFVLLLAKMGTSIDEMNLVSVSRLRLCCCFISLSLLVA
jgi:ankyrin repeat protein